MNLEQVAGECSYLMEKIALMFKPGAQVTLIVRTPGNNDADFMLTNDHLDQVCAVVVRRQAALLGENESKQSR